MCWPVPRTLLAARASSFTLTDRDGVVLRTTRARDGSRQSWTPLGSFDPMVIGAFVATEDHRFYAHIGVDATAILRAVRDNLRSRRIVSGASTITMQVARLVNPISRGWWGKAAQVLWALRLERHFSKQEILAFYLNRVPLGQGNVGVAAAAATYFDASPDKLSPGQAALLAGLAHAPSLDNPLVAPERARARRRVALSRMRAAGTLSVADIRRGADEPVLAAARRDFLAPHFTSRVLQSVDAQGTPDGTVRTTLDLALQLGVESEVRHTVEVLRLRGVREAAAVVLDNATGDVLAWVGSPDFWADTSGQVDMVTSARQPGSALKPFLYGTAFDRGYTPASVLPDIDRAYTTPIGLYHPHDYDRHFHGPVRIRQALASSYNVPAVELASRIGAASLLNTLHRAGFASLWRPADYYGLGLALGNGDVTLLELANAYRGLAALGVWRPYRWDLAAHDPAADSAGRRMMSPLAAALLLDILSDPVAREPAFGVQTPFNFPFPVAVKTGTSRHFTDNWAIGTTHGFTVAVWVGNFDGQPMEGVSGITGAGPLLERVVLLTSRRYAPGVLPRPDAFGARAFTICRVSGQRPGPWCPTTTEWFLPGTEPGTPCTWHNGDALNLPPEYRDWLDQDGRTVLPTLMASGRAPDAASAPTGFAIVSPQDGDRFEPLPGVEGRYATIALRAVGNRGPVRWLVDGRPSGARWRLSAGDHRIEAGTAAGQYTAVRISVAASPERRAGS
ncbi:MAG TPA: penicillin-binding protein 1C [Gemmatimonadales bacterium]